ncbi:TIR domain-containing protein [Cyanobium sp. FGCU-6]|nr:TIR domain-containing protein [Cyanobium sp. FGCU6]
MARVFLSHSSRDNAAAAKLKAWLEGEGFLPAFLDFDKHSGIPVGADWEHTLYEQIQLCQALLILQSPNWSASRWCFAEFTQARALGKPIFQVVESDEAAAERPIAADLQRLDLRHDRPAGLEQLRRELQRLALQDQGGFPWPPPQDPTRSPFPGLMVFEAEDAPVFFGRDNDWRAVIERLNTRRVQGGKRCLVLLGASGSGKSSLLRAGVLPRLRRMGKQWLVLPVLRPQARPLASLAQSLALALQRPETWRQLHQQLLTTTAAPALADLLAGWMADLRQAAASPEAQLLLPIDQGEELCTVAEAVERQRFVAVLAAALQPPQPLQVLMTIRADTIGSLQSLPELLNSLETLPLGPLSLDRYREIIDGPARVAGLRVEPAFVERAIHDTATEDALPLLAFALRQMHERFGADGVLALSDYQALGDAAAGHSPLESAVKKAADGVLQGLLPDQASLQALRQAFVPAMVRVSEQGEYTRRAAVWDTLPQAARPLLEALVAARLLVRRQGEGQTSTVEVTHEALLRAWPLLRGWLDDSRDFLLGSQQLEQDLAEWQAASPADKPRALLSGLKLAKGRAWLVERGEQLRPELRTYIQASQRRAARERRLLIGSAAAVFALISGAAGAAFVQLQRARAAQAAQFEATHRALIRSDPFLSVVYGLAAAKPLLESGKPWKAAQLSESLQRAVKANLAVSAPIATGQQAMWSLIKLRSGGLISSGGDGTLRRWRGGTAPSEGQSILAGQGGVTSLIELDSGELISGGADGTLRRWRDGRPLGDGRPIATGQGAVLRLVELANGELISGGNDGTLRRWRDGQPVDGGEPIRHGQGAVLSLIALADGELISGGADGTLRRWRDGQPAGDGEPIRTGQGAVLSLIELTNGELISGGSDGTLRRWRDGAPVGAGEPIRTGQQAVLSLIELGNGELISGAADGTLQRWRDGQPRGDGKPISTGQAAVISLIKLTHNELISGGADGTLRRFRLGKGADDGLTVTTGQGWLRSLIELSNGELISGGSDGTLRRWRDGKPIGRGRPILAGQGGVTSLIELASGELISGGADGTLRRWRDGRPLGDGRPIATGQGAVESLMALANGELISGGADGTLRRWRDGKPLGSARPIGMGRQTTWSLIELNNAALISGATAGTLRRWRDGKAVGVRQPVPAASGWLTSLIALREGELISGGRDGTLRRWRHGTPAGDGQPIPTGQGAVWSLIEHGTGELISGGADGTLRRWRDGRPVGDGQPIRTGQGAVGSLLELRNGALISGGEDGTLRSWTPAPIARAACRQIDLASIPTDTGLGPVVQAAEATCRALGVP